jgi:hypothetical protein
LCAKRLFTHDAEVSACAKSVFTHDVAIFTCAKRRFAHNAKRIQYEIGVFVLFPDTNAVLSMVFRSFSVIKAVVGRLSPFKEARPPERIAEETDQKLIGAINHQQ